MATTAEEKKEEKTQEGRSWIWFKGNIRKMSTTLTSKPVEQRRGGGGGGEKEEEEEDARARARAWNPPVQEDFSSGQLFLHS